MEITLGREQAVESGSAIPAKAPTVIPAKAGIQPVSFRENLLKEQEERASIRAYDRAKSTDDEAIPFEQAVEEIEKRGEP